jgi:hypothetical protein
VHERLQRDRFASTRRSMEDPAEFPRHTDQAKAEHSTCQRLLHLVVQDDVVPVRLLHLVVETPAAAPEAALIHQNVCSMVEWSVSVTALKNIWTVPGRHGYAEVPS